MKDKVLRWWTYFRRGHGTYLALILSFANFVTIQYRLLIDYIPALKTLFPSLTAFLIAFAVVYLPLTTVLGWLDYRKLSVPIESSVAALTSPWNRDVALALKLMAEDRKDEAAKILERWVR